MTSYIWTGSVNDLWSNANNWTPVSGPPGSGDDAILGANGESVVVSGVNAAVDVFTMGFYIIGPPNPPTLTVDSGRTFTINGAGSTIVDGTIDVQTGATMVWDFGGTFSNEGTIVIGQILNSNGGNGSLGIDGGVTLNEGGTLDLGQASNPFHAFSTGSITNSGMTFSDTLTNVDNTISGAGLISVSVFDNQAHGTVEASQEEGFALQISSVTFTNEGTMVAETRAVLDFGSDGGSGSLANTGLIQLDNDGDLAISGNYTITGSGSIKGAGGGSDITSDGFGAAKFTNESNIEYGGSGQIGDVGVLGVNDLTFVNSAGTVLVSGVDNTLTLDTGSHAITNNDLGVLEAEDGAQMNIDSAVTTGGVESFFMGHLIGGGGTIEAVNGGKVTISSAITPGGSGLLFGSGQILIEGGTVVMATGGTDTTPINFSGGGGTLQLNSAANTIGTIGGMVAGDAIDLAFVSFAAGDHAVWQQSGSGGTLMLVSSGGTVLDSLTLNGQYTSNDFTAVSAGGGTLIQLVTPHTIDDFNGDGISDVLWRNSSDDTLATWLMNGSAIASSANVTIGGSTVTPDSTWSVAGIGDFNGDGNADVLWRQSTTESLVTWFMNGSTGSSAYVTSGGNTITPDSTWSVAGVGDFNGDGDADVLWRQSTTGSLVEWQMNGSAISSGPFVTSGGSAIAPDSTWSVVGVGDFNGDGDADVLWRQSTTGSLAMWLMNGSTVASSALVTSGGTTIAPDSSWSIVEVGDFNGTNQAGIIWQQSTSGSLVEWQMNGTQIASSNFVTSGSTPVAPGSSWQAQAKPTDFV